MKPKPSLASLHSDLVSQASAMVTLQRETAANFIKLHQLLVLLADSMVPYGTALDELRAEIATLKAEIAGLRAERE